MRLNTQSSIDIKDYTKKQKHLIDSYLHKLFNQKEEFIKPEELWNAVKYSLLDGGKRIRGIFCIAAFDSTKQVCGSESINKNYLEDVLTTACSIEIIHAMSLIHDDLPAMDNDDLRRGKPSCHKAFGEATAILAGDAMLTLAFQLIAEQTKDISNDKKLELIRVLSRAFTLGLVPGQILDLSNNNKLNQELTKTIYQLKTAELIKAAILSGAIIALEPHQNNGLIFKTLENFGLKTGIAFQIIDDILDLTSDTKTLGKTSGKDKSQKKGTYPMLLGIERSREIALNLTEEAKLELKSLPADFSMLCELSNYIINRIN